jgi:NhaP-type Na+/H+ or K+/H+ antiporter
MRPLVLAGWYWVGIGVAVALVFFKLHKVLPGDANTDLVLTLVAPYSMYIVAESVHSSGVLSVVSGGLFLAQRRHLFLNATSRLRAVNVWESVSFILNGLVFMLIGLDLPQITADLEGVSLFTAISYGLLITLVLILTRLVSAYGALVVTMVARNFITVADARYPGTKGPFLLGWAGMRGVVSLAAALSIPVQLSNGVAFPQRNLILFITFIVILSTLVLQGLTLPYLIRKFNLPDTDHPLPEEEDYHQMYRKLAQASLVHLQNQYTNQENEHPAFQQLVRKWEDSSQLLDDELQTSDHKQIYLQLLDQQRQWLREWNKDPATNEEIVRKHLLRIDLEEERIHFL